MSAGSTFLTFSPAPTVSRSLVHELDGGFQDVSLSPIDIVERMESPKGSLEEIAEDEGRFEEVVPEEHWQPAAQGQSNPITVIYTDADSTTTLEGDGESLSAESTIPSTALGSPPQMSKFVEHLKSDSSSSQPVSIKDCIKLQAWKHNRELIDRNADGYFKMETMPSAQQSEGIAALQRTLAPAARSDTASSSTGSSQASSATTLDSTKHPTPFKKITFAKPRGRKHQTGHMPHNPAPFSLGRDLVLAGIKRRVAEPSAPARFVRLPTDPVVSFTRPLTEHGLKIKIPEPRVNEKPDSGSITSLPDIDSAGQYIFKHEKPKLDFGSPREFIMDQCVEKSCPIRWAHNQGPYHHKGHRDHTLMTGLFGHSNPPPEIWNLYRNMIESPCDLSGVRFNSRTKADEDLVLEFAKFHYGDFNDMSGEEFHRRYAGKHTASKVSPLRSEGTNSSKCTNLSMMSFSSCLWRRK